jgi:hypothetical protein
MAIKDRALQLFFLLWKHLDGWDCRGRGYRSHRRGKPNGAQCADIQFLLSEVPDLGGGGAEEESEHPIRRYARPVLGALQLGEVDRPPEEGCGEP